MAAFALFFLGWWASACYLRDPDDSDPPHIVVDEVVGQWLALVLVPLTFGMYALAFILFRTFDILKPWPIRWADRKVDGALGIMLDDVFAGTYAFAVITLLARY